MTTLARGRAALVAMPLVVLVAAFLGVCEMVGSAWPWSHVVHEDGRRTLLGTVLYVEHGSRELLLDVVLALAVAGAALWVFGERTRLSSGTRRRSIRHLTLAVAVLLGVIVGGTLVTAGVEGLVENLAQMPTRPGAPLRWGGHWRYHLLGRFAAACLALALAGAVAWFGPGELSARGRGRVFTLALVVFGVASLVFGLTREPFVDPVFLGHQLRELMTHALVTVPLGLWACLGLAARGGGPASHQDGRCARPVRRDEGEYREYLTEEQRCRPGCSAGRLQRDSHPGLPAARGGDTVPAESESSAPIVVAGLAAGAAGAYLLVGTLVTGARTQGQVEGLGALVFPHFFEHTLSYAVVATVAALVYLSCARSDERGPA